MLIETDYSALARAGQDGLPLKVGGGVVAIGNFDGVHRGHQALLAEGKALAGVLGKPLLALTFEPHPRRHFNPQQPPFLLGDPVLRTALLHQAGADHVVQLRFDMLLAAVTAQEFIQNILLNALQVQHVIVGNNFVFGTKRGGDVAMLQAWGREKGFAVTAMPQIADVGGVRISSQAVREAVKNGQMATAEELLGRPWILRGEVVRGDQRGRELGWPTANIGLAEYIPPKFGIYAARVQIEGEPEGTEKGGTWYDAVLNIGIRPMFALTLPLLEVHLLDVQKDLYGKQLRVAFYDFIRAEAHFSSLDVLKAQIARDAKAAREILRNRPPLGIIGA